MKVPTYDNFQSRPSGGGTPGFQSVDTSRGAQIALKQVSDLGGAVQGAADAGIKVDLDIQNQANQVRVDDAVNQMRERAMKLTYDPQEGYLNLKGNAALQRPDGMALPEEYGDKLANDVSGIAGGLANDEQRRMFAMRSNDFTTGFKGDVQGHMLKEFQGYHQSVADGNYKLSIQDAELNWNNPAKITAAIDGVEDPVTGQRYGGVKQAIYQKAQLSGMSAVEAQAAMNDAESSIHAKVIQSALTNENVTYANGYFETNKSKMTADDILQVQGQVSQKMDAHTAITATSDTVKDFSGAFNPSGMDRLTGVVQSLESGGRRFGRDGKILTSSEGAKGEMQVVDGTNRDPGFGVKPAQNDSPEERARVGRDYIGAMVTRYGDVPKALAAYNAGPGTVDKAIAAATKAGNANDWLSHMREFQSADNNAETMAYVQNGVSKFNAGAGAPRMPTENEFINTAVTKLGENPRLEALTATRTQAAAQYKLMVDARKQQGEAALSTAQQELIANGGNFNTLQPQTISDLSRFDPAKYDDAMKFAKAISEDNKPTDMAAYSAAVLHPNELAAMPEPVFLQFLHTNFAKTDQEKIVNLRAGQLNGTNDDSASAINNEALNQTIANRLTNLQINPSPEKKDVKEAARVGAIQKFIRDDIYTQQNAIGRKLNPKELEERVDQLFAKSVDLPGVLWGKNQEKLITMEFSDIPNPMRVALRKEFVTRGVQEPTDNDILQAYWRYTNKGKQNGG